MVTLPDNGVTNRIFLKKSGSLLPRVELLEMGPSFDFEVRRLHLSSTESFRKACCQPRVNNVSQWYANSKHYYFLVQAKKTKNVSHDIFGTKMGRVHMQRQEFDRLQTRKIKGLKRSKQTKTVPSSKKHKISIE